MSAVDLHIHTVASDGRYSPAEIVRKAARLGMSVIAITDHDSVNGVAEAIDEAKKFTGLTVIPGVEISTDVPAGEVHVLGYFIDYKSERLRDTFERMGDARKERARKVIDKLNKLGIHILWQRVAEIAGKGTVGRPHIAEAMLEKRYIATFKEAFTKYIGRGGPAYVEWKKMTPVRAVEMVLDTGGLPVLAHPLTASNPESLITELKAAGLTGIEVYYNGYKPEETEILLDLARNNDLILTGGSDYHGIDDTVETDIGGVPVPLESVESLIALAGKVSRLKHGI